MNKLLFAISILALILLSSCRKTNHPPSIQYASSTPDILLVGESCQFSCVATDEDGDLLTYIWSCSDGSFPSGASGQSVLWTAPLEPGVSVVTIIASDGKNTAQDTFQITVNKQIVNTPPMAKFELTPESGTVASEFQVDASGSSDAETPFDALEFRWDWTNDGIWDTDYSTSQTETHQYAEPGAYTIILEVKDEGGLLDKKSGLVSVSALPDTAGTFEYKGREYDYKKIGTQTWMTENLAFLPSVSASDTGSDDDPYYYVYDYEGSSVSSAKESDNYTTKGVLYNWEAAKISCPPKWHLPSDDDWKKLETHLGMNPSDVDDIDWRNSGNVGHKLKSISSWTDGNGDNSSGFDALPGGLRAYGGGFYDIDVYGNFWSSSHTESSKAWTRYMGSMYEGVNRAASEKRRGFSVRCIRD